MKNMTGHKDSQDDGIFWMDFNDFVQEFDTVYVCRVYNEENGWYTEFINDKWHGEYAEGYPTDEYPQAKIEKNPTFGVTCTKPGKGYVVLRLLDEAKREEAVQTGILVMQANNGKLVKDINNKQIPRILLLGPNSFPIQAKEITFPSNLSYPYTFSFIVANMNHGPEGEGKFSVQLFSQDNNMDVKKLN